jgi:hypothetical protein
MGLLITVVDTFSASVTALVANEFTVLVADLTADVAFPVASVVSRSVIALTP